ncbi:MAG: hypothetical protein HRU24_13285 [Gammaproteobacteria bacterium]|nr:hypothetical protein [Gammaproteobacteria bacterium]
MIKFSNADVQASIISSLQDHLVDVIDSIEFEKGKLSDDEQKKLIIDLQEWLDHSVVLFGKNS